MLAKPGIAGLLLLGATAYGVYRYSKLSEDEKNDLINKGKKFFEDNLGGLKNIFGQDAPKTTTNSYAQNGSAQG